MQKAKINGTSVSLHPGIIKTGLQRYVLCNWWRKLLAFIISPIYLFLLKTSTQGAQTSLFCLLEDDNSIIKGGHYSDCKITKTSSSQV
jgi:retinol dehydrogenase-12